MSVMIHPAAVVEDGAQLGVDVRIGPGAVIGPYVKIGDGSRIDANALVTGWTTMGARCQVHHGGVVGSTPQDLKYRGEQSYLVVGDETIIREYCTLNLATDEGATTRVGSNCLLMAYSHVGHNTQVGNRVVMANAVQLAGYVFVEDWAIIGGGSVVHQFTRIGRHCIIGGGSRVVQDVAPFTMAAGSPPRCTGINKVGLERRGFSTETREALDRAYRLLFRGGTTVAHAVAEMRERFPHVPEVEEFARFAETTVRGLSR
jgi:UDP-N-acetylglucosamine acyltransferase